MLNENEWNALIKDLKDGNCCLLLGTEINCIDVDGIKYTSTAYFSHWLKNKLLQNDPEFNAINNSHFYLLKKYIEVFCKGKDLLVEDDIIEFSRVIARIKPDFYSKIARLPFKSVVCTTQDNFFTQALTQFNYAFHEEIYEYAKIGDSSIELDLEEEMQLVLNLFGVYSNASSVPRSEKSFLQQIKNISSGLPQINTKILARFKNERKMFIFLGVNFYEWYLRLIFDSLKIPIPPAASFHPRINNGAAFAAYDYFTDNYGVKFLDIDTFEFVDELKARYETNYGGLDVPPTIAIDYDDSDERVYDSLRLYLNPSLPHANISSKNDIPLVGVANAFDNIVAAADVYIAIISTQFINNPACNARFIKSLQDNNQKKILIKSRSVDYQRVLNHYNAVNVAILPKDQTILSTLTNTELDEKCYKLSRLINCIVR